MTDCLTTECTTTGFWQRACRQAFFSKLKNLRYDGITLSDGASNWEFGEPDLDQRQLHLTVYDPRFYTRVWRGGAIGAAESWMDADWSCNDLPRLIRWLIRNQSAIEQFDRGFVHLRKSVERFVHWLRRNSLVGSKSNIRAHYDLGNDLFSLFLDPTMNYSSAIFESLPPGCHSESLHRAQLRKMKVLCDTLELSAENHLLEIGSGWGSLACFAAKHYGCKVSTTTISREQFLWTCQRVKAEGLESQVTVLEQDYRTLQGKFDKIISVEMIEAVGDQFYDTFFRKCQNLLKPDGLLLLQAITIVDQRYHQHLKSVDFICKYIFPGGSLPSVSRLVQSAAQSAEMRLVKLDDYAAHYAETLRRWRGRFWNQIDAVRELGYSERFIRMWDYYLAYCEAAFEERQINLVHALFAQRSSRFIPKLESREFDSASFNLDRIEQFTFDNRLESV